MKKIILAAMSAGILSGCSSAPPLASPKGEFVEMNTDITTLLPQVEPVYTGNKPTKVAEISLVNHGKPTGKKEVPVSSDNVNNKKELTGTGLLKPNIPMSKPIELKGYIVPVLSVASKTDKKLDSTLIVKSAKPATTSVQGRNPFSGGNRTIPLASVMHKPTIAPTVVVLPPVNRLWEIKKGTTLITGFTEWLVKEKCPFLDGKWKLQRETDTDYSIDYPLSFRSVDFENAAKQLFSLYSNAEEPIIVRGYRKQCLIVISGK